MTRQSAIRKCITGYCDYLGEEHSAYAEYMELKFIGDPVIHMKYMGLKCEYSKDCDIEECDLDKRALSFQR